MSNLFRSTILTVVIMQVHFGASIFANDGGRITLEGPDRVVRGFPMVVRATATGPMVVPMAEIQHTLEDLSVTLMPRSGGAPYEIHSNRSMEFDLSLPGEGMSRDGADLVNLRIGEGEKMVGFLDVASLRTFGKEVRFVDVPPGSYRMTLTVSVSKVTSGPIAFDLIEPTAQDQAFLDEVMMRSDRMALQTSPSRPHRPILWPELITASQLWEMPLDRIDKLSPWARSQVELHALLYRIGRGDAITRAEARDHPVPKYLEDERDWRLLEFDAKRGVANAQTAMERFAEEKPGFRWRLNRFVAQTGQ